jgi:hypothetical protein
MVYYNEKACPHCGAKKIRSQNLGDKVINLSKDIFEVAKPVSAVIKVGKMFRTFVIDYEKLRNYEVCDNCEKVCLYCSSCENYFSLSSRPTTFQKVSCNTCFTEYYIKGK